MSEEGSGGTEESLNNLGGSMIGVIIIVTLVSIIALIVYPYLPGNKARFTVAQSFNRLFNTIDNSLVKDGDSATDFFNLIDNFILVGFGKKGFNDFVRFDCGGKKRIEKPDICGENACICVCKKHDDCKDFHDCKLLKEDIENIIVSEKIKYNSGTQIDPNDESKGYFLFFLNNPFAYISKDDDSKIVLSLKRVGNDILISEYKP
ncbi:MAG: hypothetical protein ACQXXF_08030 [Thermoplasmatota archaeon]|jgi:hypothetical protein